MNKVIPIFFAIFFISMNSLGQDKFPNTLSFNDSIESPSADISDIEWIAGLWRGEALGGIIEEAWTPPLGGSMMGAFKLVVNNKVNFYELEIIMEVNSSLILRLKHFHSDLKGWEKKDDTIDFKLVKITNNKVYFDNYTFERINKDELNVYVVLQNGEEKNEVKFHYKRVTY